MPKLTGIKNINVAVFISGTGSNFINLIEHSFKKKSKFKIKLVISNNPKAKGLKYAKKYKIKKKIINYKNLKNSEKDILSELDKTNIQIICLAGFMKILTVNFIKRFKGKIINIHPSLLPKYKGLNTHERVLDNNENYSGCTVHYVNSKLDAGKIILQKKVKIFKNDSSEKLSKRILKHEHLLYPRALKKIISSL
ncbi:phosphoribosylglycinamide formyltransferase [Candidatus Pelagibacter sp. HIMB1321]|uniref:phosphoribosylglycinamide formyltransferase n=1 Tax=Candidatus Pelagibacter sp. HIMB1321 TaxID=1388755 RepID=UPI000A07F1D3|nr:phosphoribosylglycinamide formyltransferase [Candidatus Pelagibacter sp. HIMB1321]SMF72449.1 formyltetrahydrofolate-dependent phosphoribosylglycinamide formyltransferase [Candidatus Pelagibacter sp. HIMB1321]